MKKEEKNALKAKAQSRKAIKKAKKEKIHKEIQSVDDCIAAFKNSNNMVAFSEEEGKSTIFIDLTKGAAFNDYSSDSILNGDLYDYVENAYAALNKRNELCISFIYPETMTQAERDKIVAAFKAHFAIKYREMHKAIRNRLVMGLLLIFVGLVLLLIMNAYKSGAPDSLYVEAIDIMAWVFIWEGTSVLFLSSLEDGKEQRENIRIYTSEIK
jgi:hypothetical protein